MPLSFVAETLLRFVFETVIYFFGYATGWFLVPALTFGYYTADPIPPPSPRRRRDRTVGRTAIEPRRLSENATAAGGMLLWLDMAAGGALFWWLAKP
jgi:hypothetical protein